MDVAGLCDVIYLAAALDRERVNDVFDIGPKEFDFHAVLDRARHGRRIIPLPEVPVNMARATLRVLRLSPVCEWACGTVSKEFVSIAKDERVLGFSPRYSNKQTLLRNYEWCLQNLDCFSGSSGVLHRVPWSQGILRLTRHFF